MNMVAAWGASSFPTASHAIRLSMMKMSRVTHGRADAPASQAGRPVLIRAMGPSDTALCEPNTARHFMFRDIEDSLTGDLMGCVFNGFSLQGRGYGHFLGARLG